MSAGPEVGAGALVFIYLGLRLISVEFEFAGDEVFVGFAFADYLVFAAIDQYLYRAGAGVVVAGHAEAVGTGGEDGNEGAAVELGEFEIFAEDIGGFADGAGDVLRHIDTAAEKLGEEFALGEVGSGYRPEKVGGVVQGGADKIVHAGVEHGEVFDAVTLGILYLTYENSGVTNDGAAGFDEQFFAGGLDGSGYGFGVAVEAGNLFGIIKKTETAASIDIFYSRRAGGGKVEEPVDGFAIWFDRVYRAAQMDIDPFENDIGEMGEAGDQLHRPGEIDTEFVLLLAGSGLGVAFGVDIRVYAEGDGGGKSEFTGDMVYIGDLGLTLAVEEHDSLL